MIIPKNPHTARGVVILTLTTFIWGTTFVVTKQSLVGFPASALIFSRFLVAGIIVLPFLRPGRRQRRETRRSRRRRHSCIGLFLTI